MQYTSWLYTPASNPRFIRHATDSKAHVVIYDLEDSVPDSYKELARNNFISILKTQAMKPICARINSPQTHEGMSDLMAIKDSGIAPDIIIIPKANILLDGHLVYCMLKDINPAIKIYVLVESISGLSEIRTIASVPSYIAGTLFGSADFLADMCISPSDSDCSWARQELAVQARRLGIEA
ncbi:aldolase/citrate lyase family protein, partial [Pseudomonas savastanoi]